MKRSSSILFSIIIAISLSLFFSGCASSIMSGMNTGKELIQGEMEPFSDGSLSFSLHEVFYPGKLAADAAAQQGYKAVQADMTIANTTSTSAWISFNDIQLAAYHGTTQMAYPPRMQWRGHDDINMSEANQLGGKGMNIAAGKSEVVTFFYYTKPDAEPAGVLYNKNTANPVGRFWLLRTKL